MTKKEAVYIVFCVLLVWIVASNLISVAVQYGGGK